MYHAVYLLMKVDNAGKEKKRGRKASNAEKNQKDEIERQEI